MHRVYDAVTEKTDTHYLDEALLARPELTQWQLDRLVAGFLGTARLDTVATTKEINQQTSQQKREEVATGLQRGEALIARVGLEKAPSFTIHGDGIIFSAEVSQDRANAAEALGGKEEAQSILQTALRENHDRLSRIARETIDFQIPDEQLRDTDYDLYKNRKELIGALWAQPVLSARLGRLTFDQPLMRESVKQAQEAFTHQQNGARLATFAVWSGAAALDFIKFRGPLGNRPAAFSEAVVAYKQAEKVDPDGARHALNHFIDQQKTRIKDKLRLRKAP